MIVEYAYILLSALRLNTVRRRYAHQWKERVARERAAEEARRDRYASWLCPDCGRRFGPKVQYVNYARDNAINTARGPFTRHVIITCKYCHLLNVYDPAGVSLFEPGELVADRKASQMEGE